ncbi:aromatic ring-hydroxylating oxygenase subunit alpha [Sphingobium nicotianae]|uniref:Rieske 2Fe-2S domain-containing protein n=1 Tax=Sphingobium nicotianae TaxID=2782607 RepID=A0A9X1ISZ2_9SPHN|nr:SRPBCC family protein [Sphingobium nicotianae]MBT2189043.1 Rieske 2Fe-2S domain-containing protein [Sphingobium nicotianae]
MKPYRLVDLVDDRPAEGVFRVNRALFSDPELFDLEMKHVFESGWVFLGMASQAADLHDYFTTRIGRIPVIVARGKDGVLRCFVNSCPHKGARIATQPSGNARLFACPYHSWTFDSSGACKNVKWHNAGAYGQGFTEEDHDLAPIARFGEYRGFLFGSLSADVPSLDDHLGEARHMLDLVADQSDEGLELVPGRVRFTFAANWKMQLENCSDQYHFTSTHPSLIKVLERRAAGENGAAVKSSLAGADFWKGGDEGIVGGSYIFEHGHVVTWGRMEPNPSQALYSSHTALLEKFGADRTAWMFNMRNLSLFPNAQVAVNASTQLRVIRPIAHNLTEMETWCLVPKGESAEARRLRIRQYEDFFNPTGMAIADDNAVYEECQTGMTGQDGPWLQGHARGLAATRKGGNDLSDRLGMEPVSSVAGPSQLADETLFQGYYHAWLDRMSEVLA